MMYPVDIYDLTYENELSGMDCDYEVWHAFVVDAILYEHILEHVAITVYDDSELSYYRHVHKVICLSHVVEYVNRKLHMVNISRLSSMDDSIAKYMNYLVEYKLLEKLEPYSEHSHDLYDSDDYYILTDEFHKMI